MGRGSQVSRLCGPLLALRTPLCLHLRVTRERSDMCDASFALSNTSPGYCLQKAATWRSWVRVTLLPPKRLSSTSQLTALVR